MQLLEWAAYYVAESQFSEEEAQNWVDACLAQPDPPGFTPDPATQEEAAAQADVQEASSCKVASEYVSTCRHLVLVFGCNLAQG